MLAWCRPPALQRPSIQWRLASTLARRPAHTLNYRTSRARTYDHEHAKRCLAQLPTELEAQRPGALAALRELLEPRSLTVDELQRCVSSVLLRIISVEISLEGTENHVRAAVSDVVEKVQRAKAAKANKSRV